MIITVYANDHLPPHFHIIAPDLEALVEIETLAVLRGEIGRAASAAVLTWWAEHRAELAAEWNRINPRFPIARGNPLKEAMPRFTAVVSPKRA